MIFAYNFNRYNELYTSFQRYLKYIVNITLEKANDSGESKTDVSLLVHVCIEDDISQLYCYSRRWKGSVYWLCTDKLEVILKLHTDRNRMWDIKTWEKIIENQGWEVVIFPWNFKDLVHFKRRNHG